MEWIKLPKGWYINLEHAQRVEPKFDGKAVDVIWSDGTAYGFKDKDAKAIIDAMENLTDDTPPSGRRGYSGPTYRG